MINEIITLLVAFLFGYIAGYQAKKSQENKNGK